MLSEGQAHDVAWAFAKKDASRSFYPLRSPAVKVSFGSDYTGKKILGCQHDFWTFVFQMEVPAGVVLDPDIAIVLVDPKSGKADYLPVM